MKRHAPFQPALTRIRMAWLCLTCRGVMVAACDGETIDSSLVGIWTRNNVKLASYHAGSLWGDEEDAQVETAALIARGSR